MPVTTLSRSVATRCTAQIIRWQSEAPFVEPLTVEPSVCAVAMSSSKVLFLSPSGWSKELAAYLMDNGIDGDLIEEHLPVRATPLWPTRTVALPEALKETRSDPSKETGDQIEDVREPDVEAPGS